MTQVAQINTNFNAFTENVEQIVRKRRRRRKKNEKKKNKNKKRRVLTTQPEPHLQLFVLILNVVGLSSCGHKYTADKTVVVG